MLLSKGGRIGSYNFYLTLNMIQKEAVGEGRGTVRVETVQELARKHDRKGNIVVCKKSFRDKGRKFKIGNKLFCSKRERIVQSNRVRIK